MKYPHLYLVSLTERLNNLATNYSSSYEYSLDSEYDDTQDMVKITKEINSILSQLK